MHSYFKIIVLILTLFTQVGCGNTSRIDSEEIEMSSKDRELVIKMILDHPDLQQYLHPELLERIPVKVSHSSFSNQDISISKFGESVLISSEKSTANSPNLDFVTFSEVGNSIKFEIAYDIEGVTVKGLASKTGDSWNFSNFEVYEK